MKQSQARRWFVFYAAVLTVFMFSVAPGSAQRRRAVLHPARLSPDCKAAELPASLAEACRESRLAEGKRLFGSEKFGGNGRTCSTCHSAKTGTFSIADVRNRLAANRSDPLFLHDALDDGVSGTSRIEKNATIRVTLPIPKHLTLVSNPSATHVTFNRATPTTMNTPALDPRLMSDLRAATLTVQALGAIQGHFQNTIEPSALQLELIAEFQQKDPRFFSSELLRRFAQNGETPRLPEGTTDAERRGRSFFEDASFAPPSKAGVCALCHSGPMLNEANVFSTAVFGGPPGTHIFSAGVSERNFAGNPTYTFDVREGGTVKRVTTPDIGILMTDKATAPFLAEELPPPFVQPLSFFANFFKTPTLWGTKDTAPYFHDNSAKDMDEMLEHYNWFFENSPIGKRIQLTPEDIADVKAYMNLL